MIRELTDLIHENSKFPLFGILLFTEEHPHLVKMLRDKDYFKALNELSGDNMALFATMLFSGEYEYPVPPPGTLAMIGAVWKEPLQNKKIYPWFNIKDGRELPLLVIFGHEKGDFYYQKYPLKSKSKQEVFNRLGNALSRISLVANRVKKDQVVKKNELFRMARWEIKKLGIEERIADFFELAATFRGAMGK